MKRLILAVVTVVMVLVVVMEAGVLYRMVSMVARGESPRQQEGKADEPEEPTGAEDTGEPGEPAVAEDAGAEAQGERLSETGDIGDYHVEIGDMQSATDTSGNAAVIVTYTWTNNSDASASAMVMLMERAYQGETRLTSAQVEAAGYDSDSGSRTVGPGSTGTVQRAFVLEEEDGALTFEVSEFLSHTNNAVVKEFDLSK